MKYCVNCGEEINEQAEICSECGVNQGSVPDGSHGDRDESEKHCTECGELINKQSEVCPECGVRQELSSGSDASASTDRTTAGLLALLFGGVGVHKFYQGNNKMGILYLCFCWTLIPALLAFIEAIMMLTADDETYAEKYADGDILGN